MDDIVAVAGLDDVIAVAGGDVELLDRAEAHIVAAVVAVAPTVAAIAGEDGLCAERAAMDHDQRVGAVAAIHAVEAESNPDPVIAAKGSDDVRAGGVEEGIVSFGSSNGRHAAVSPRAVRRTSFSM